MSKELKEVLNRRMTANDVLKMDIDGVLDALEAYITSQRADAVREYAKYIASNISPLGASLIIKKTEEYLKKQNI